MEPTPDGTSETGSTTTSIKRKADEAFDALDDALRPRTDLALPPKRVHSSIYDSLERYGIINRSNSPSKTTSTPTLTALLTRARSKRDSKILPTSQHAKLSSATPEYSPGSTDAFLNRLSTFSFSTYASKPPQIDAVAASKSGWINEGGKDRLYCTICRVGWVVAGRDALNQDAVNTLVEKQRQSLVDMHKEGCPWRVRQCDPLVYRVPLKSPAYLARQIKARASELESVLNGIAIRHPLSMNQVQVFVQTVSSVQEQGGSFPSTSTEGTAQPPNPSPSTASLLASLFGWSLVPTPPPLSRKSSSVSLTLARTHSRSSSVPIYTDISGENTPTPGDSIISMPQKTLKVHSTPFGTPLNAKAQTVNLPALPASLSVVSSRGPPQQKDAMLQCQMCQRRIGLWAFAAPSTSPDSSSMNSPPILAQNTTRPQRQLDILREHRSYCPYVVKSTPLASLPSYPSLPPHQSQPSMPRSSFNLARNGAWSSAIEAQNSTSAFNLRSTTSILSSVSSSATQAMSSEMQEHNLVEGWRAVYNTVLRFGMSERPRAMMHPSGNPSSLPGTESVVEQGEKAEDDVMNGVVELVEGVKRHGGKQLLSYVRNLLGQQ